MRQIVELYIGDNKVEFNEPPALLYTYQETDLTNPTVVKNSFSKTITIEGTPTNNKIFGHYWNVERVQGQGTSSGVYFNASKKTDFTLYVNSEIYESGYCKLDNVRTQGRNILYDITLYGGLGDFFFGLSTNENNGEKRKLSDLDFGTDLDFTINIDTVKEAWDNIDDPDYPKWNTINFAPCYEGYADDFDSDKVIINTEGTDLKQTKIEDGVTYKTKDNFVLGTLPNKMSGAEMRDLRSYLQRPVIRMKKIIEACCNPENNGGYEVNLDPDFFSNSNPYWTDTWLTLPSIPELEYTNKQQTLTGSTLITGTTTGNTSEYFEQPLTFSLGQFSDDITTITVAGTVKVNNGHQFENTSYAWFWNWNGDSYHTGNWCMGSLYVQLVAYNGSTLVGASPAYNLTTPVRHNGKLYFGCNQYYENKFVAANNMPIYDELGTFKSNGFVRENASSPHTFYFTINNLVSNITDLKLRYYFGRTDDKVKKDGATCFYRNTYSDGWITFERESSPNNDASKISFNVTSTNLKAVAGESIGKTGTNVSKNVLLNTENSPADYLLSYCKMFGLYFTKDVLDKKIYIQSRKTFYERSKIVDLTQYMDKSKEVKMTPITFDSKWYQFDLDKDNSDFAGRYKLAYGVEYGSKIVDTGYGFNSEKKDLLKDLCIKSGVEGLEKSKGYTQYADDTKWRPWMEMGTSYQLYDDEGNTIDVVPNVTRAGQIYGINEGKNMRYFDLFPKVQFHDGEGKALDGNDVLLFFSGFKSTSAGRSNALSYILSDDNQYMTVLNEGTPCWLFSPSWKDSKGNRLCYNLSQIPVFERYRTRNGSGTITQSLDFGAPRELYTPNYTYEKAITIYDAYWSSYIEDMYSADNKVLSCYVRLAERPNPNWLRRFYWFDNALWRLNKIQDWNVSSFDTTKMEFIKVDDVNNYTSNTQVISSDLQISLNKNKVSYNGETIIATVTASAGQAWSLFYDDKLIVGITGGTGTRSFNITVPLLRGKEARTFTITARADVSVSANILQEPYGLIQVQEYGSLLNKTVPTSGGTCYVEVTSTFPWHVETTSSFVTISPLSGNGGTTDVSVVFNESLGLRTRSVLVNFVDIYGNTVSWNKSQGNIREIKDILPRNPLMSRVYYETGADVFVPEWASVNDNGDGSYDIEYNDNYGGERTGTIRFESPEKRKDGTSVETVYLQINQLAGEPERLSIERTDSTGDVNPMGGTVGLRVLSDKRWTLSSDSVWATLSVLSGETDTDLTLTVAENRGPWREATLTLENINGLTVNYKVSQGSQSMPITVSPSELHFEANGGSQFVNVLLRNPWVAIPSNDWFTISSRRADGAGVISVTATQNGDDSRTGTITFIDTVTTETYTVSVQQAGQTETRSLTVSPNPMNVSYNGGRQSITLVYNNRNGDVVIPTTSDEEITLDGYPSWTGDNGTYAVVVEPNSATTQRTFAVVYNCEKTVSQEIVQEASPERANPEDAILYFPRNGGTKTDRILSNTPWSATTSESWITISPVSGSTEWTNMTIIVQPNFTTESRTGYISIKSTITGDEIGRITVIQEVGDYLIINPSSLEMEASGGTYTFTISSNINWTIE